jgi:hypothetical protein
MPLHPRDYARASALITHATLIKSVEASYPTLTIAEQNEILVDILDRIARMRGWSLRREVAGAEEGE